MSENTLPDPIELTDAELTVVSGGRGGTNVAAGISQRIDQSASLAQVGGDLNISGSVSGAIVLVETFVGAITQVATNVNTGPVNITVAA